ncbi:MAG TPA: aspartate-semialdehyde dehydrogenase [Acidobacteriota bacterium]|nr:aspartate-semialdehyde dehydrogenase [Acidobacteriota bacterium]
MSEKVRVGILGATGAVGQKFALLLDGHPWFEVGALAASERRVGEPYGETVNWKQSGEIPESLRAMRVQSCSDELDCPVVFSGLDSSVAGEVEQDFARRGCWVFSNAKNHRMDEDVPLVITELNPDHLELIPIQRRRRNWRGAIVTNANCSTIALAMALGPLHQKYELDKVHVVTMQALSGAGYPGVPSLDILGNVVPYIGSEEDKIESEAQKILGRFLDGRVEHADFTVSAQANRVAVEEGHLECVSLSFRGQRPSMEEVRACWTEFRGQPQRLGLPSAPPQPVVVRSEPDRPQPRLDVWTQNGMAAVIGRLRPCPLLDYKFLVLGHNTVRGAAGASILNAEYVYRDRFLGS